jgi:hypothetical protein
VRHPAHRLIEGSHTDAPESGRSADSDAGHTAPDHADPRSIPLQTTTEHLRQLWLAGGRDITVTYDDDAVRHRTYLAHPRNDT